MKILIIYAGGTIGQVWDPVRKCSRPPESDADFSATLEKITSSYKDISFSYKFYTTKESSNMQPEDWQNLADLIYVEQLLYDAVIVAHGTDTLAHTACALALAFYNPDIQTSELLIPIILTGAQIEMFRPTSDGDDNLANCIETGVSTAEKGIADVLIVFGRSILLGARTTKTSEVELDAFHSPSFPTIGRILASGVRLENPPLARMPDVRERMFIRQIYQSKNSKTAPTSRFAINKPSNGLDENAQGISVLTISYQPGLSPLLFKALVDQPEVVCVIIRSLGAGNICTEGRPLLPVITYAYQQYGLPVMITSSFIGGNIQTKDETGVLAIRAGIIPSSNYTEPAICVKSQWLIANGLVKDLESFVNGIQTSFVNEVDFPKILEKTQKPSSLGKSAVANEGLSFAARLARYKE